LDLVSAERCFSTLGELLSSVVVSRESQLPNSIDHRVFSGQNEGQYALIQWADAEIRSVDCSICLCWHSCTTNDDEAT